MRTCAIIHPLHLELETAKLIIGSVTQKVLSDSKIPVVVYQ
jgi:nucleotide-binding universal stress UspA family protein